MQILMILTLFLLCSRKQVGSCESDVEDIDKVKSFHFKVIEKQKEGYESDVEDIDDIEDEEEDEEEDTSRVSSDSDT